MINRKTLCILIFFLSACCYANDTFSELNRLGFVEKDIPKGNDWFEANHCNYSYVVEFNDTLIIRKESMGYNEQGKVFEAGDLIYRGVDRGEFSGGGLYLESKSDTTTRMMSGNVQHLVPVQKSLYIFTGLDHLLLRYGKVSIIQDYENPSVPERVTLLPGEPDAICFESNPEWPNFAIAGGDYFALLLLRGGEELNIVAINTFWGGLGPTSVVKYHDDYILGIRSGIAVVEAVSPYDYKIRYFVPK